MWVEVWTLANRRISGQGSITAEEAVRTFARANQRANHDPRARNLLDRNRKHQQGDARRNEERRRRDEEHTRRLDNRQGRRRHVSPSLPPNIPTLTLLLLLLLSYHPHHTANVSV